MSNVGLVNLFRLHIRLRSMNHHLAGTITVCVTMSHEDKLSFQAAQNQSVLPREVNYLFAAMH